MRRNEPTEKERFTILLENLYGEIKTIKEGQDATESRLNKKIDVVVENLSEVKSNVRLLARDMGLVKQDVAVLKTDVAGLKEDMVGVKKNISLLQSDVAEIRTHLPPIHDVLMDHQHRIKKLEAI